MDEVEILAVPPGATPVAIDLSVPMPGFILKRTMKGGVETATEGLRKQVLKVAKG